MSQNNNHLFNTWHEEKVSKLLYDSDTKATFIGMAHMFWFVYFWTPGVETKMWFKHGNDAPPPIILSVFPLVTKIAIFCHHLTSRMFILHSVNSRFGVWVNHHTYLKEKGQNRYKCVGAAGEQGEGSATVHPQRIVSWCGNQPVQRNNNTTVNVSTCCLKREKQWCCCLLHITNALNV